MHDASFQPVHKEITLKYERILAQQVLSAHRFIQMDHLEVETFLHPATRDLVVKLSRYMAYLESDKSQRLRVPATWWDHFKVRWFPAWALVRWPAEFTEYRAKMLFPEVPKIPGTTIRFAVFDHAWDGPVR